MDSLLNLSIIGSTMGLSLVEVKMDPLSKHLMDVLIKGFIRKMDQHHHFWVLLHTKPSK